MPSTRKHTKSIDPEARRRADQVLDTLLFHLGEAAKAAAILNRPHVRGGTNALWRCLSARHADESVVVGEKERNLLVRLFTTEIALAVSRVILQTGFVTGSQSRSDEKPSESVA